MLKGKHEFSPSFLYIRNETHRPKDADAARSESATCHFEEQACLDLGAQFLSHYYSFRFFHKTSPYKVQIQHLDSLRDHLSVTNVMAYFLFCLDIIFRKASNLPLFFLFFMLFRVFFVNSSHGLWSLHLICSFRLVFRALHIGTICFSIWSIPEKSKTGLNYNISLNL